MFNNYKMSHDSHNHNNCFNDYRPSYGCKTDHCRCDRVKPSDYCSTQRHEQHHHNGGHHNNWRNEWRSNNASYYNNEYGRQYSNGYFNHPSNPVYSGNYNSYLGYPNTPTQSDYFTTF